MYALFKTRFKHKNPEDINEVPGGFLLDCNQKSLEVMQAYGDVSLKNADVYSKFQFERIGFFSVDPDSTHEKVSL
jgi:glutaminyl-tRNA synthetase